MKTVCVYLGASLGSNKAFEQATIKLAREIVDKGLTLIYGGSSSRDDGDFGNNSKIFRW